MKYFCIFTFFLLFSGPPAPKLPQVVEVDVTTKTITISLSPSDDTNGEIMWVLGNPYVRLAFVILRPAILPFLYSKKVGGGGVVWEGGGHRRV